MIIFITEFISCVVDGQFEAALCHSFAQSILRINPKNCSNLDEILEENVNKLIQNIEEDGVLGR